MEKKIAIGLMFTAVGLLSLLGLAYAWASPWDYMGTHGAFKRMVCWSGIGAALGCCAWLVDWKHWKRYSIVVSLAWIGLLVWAMQFPAINGTPGWIPIGGVVAFNVWEFMPLAVAMLGVWVSDRFKLKSLAALGLTLLCLGTPFVAVVSRNANRVEKVKAVLSGDKTKLSETGLARAYQVDFCCRAVKASRWIGPSDFDVRYLPERMTSCMPAASTVLFGRWFLVALAVAVILLGVGFVLAWLALVDEPCRVLVAATGFAVVGKAMLGIFGSLGFLPFRGECVPLATFYGSLTVATLVAVGVICSGLRKEA